MPTQTSPSIKRTVRWLKSPPLPPECINTRDGSSYRLDTLPPRGVITLGEVLCGYLMHPEIKSLGPDGRKCKPDVRGLLRRIAVYGGLQHCIGKEVSRYEQGTRDFIENIDDMCIHYSGGRVAANKTLLANISARGLRQTTRDTGLDRKTIRAVLNRKKVKIATRAQIVIGLQRN